VLLSSDQFFSRKKNDLKDENEIATKATVFDFLIPFLLSLLYLPFIYLLSVYMAYERIFLVLSHVLKDASLYQFAQKQTLFHFGFRAKDMDRWKDTILLSLPKSKDEILSSIHKIKQEKKAERNPAPIDQEKGWSPYKAKNFLVAVGIEAGYYKNVYGDEWAASSKYIDLNDGLVSNNIAYYISGNREVATSLKLVLNVNWPESAATAHSKLTEYVEELYKSALDKSLSDSIVQALMYGAEETAYEGNKRISIVKDSWPGHGLNGYHITVEIKAIAIELIIQNN
jgi:hypothetical protein